MSALRPAALCVAACFSNVVATSAQDTLRISGTPECSDCRIQITRVATLGDRSDSVSVYDRDLLMVVQHLDQFIVTPMADFRTVGLYGGDGKLRAPFAPMGSGPGEIQLAYEVRPMRGDSILVVDRALRRLSIFAPDHSFSRAITPELIGEGVLPLPNGNFVVHAHRATPSDAGMFIHILDPQGALLSSPGAAEYWQEGTGDTKRLLAPARDGGFWVGRINKYVIEKRAPDGTLEFVLKREAAWFTPWNRRPALFGDVERPVTRIDAIREDSMGRLWILAFVPEQGWEPSRSPAADEEHIERPFPRDSERMQWEDTMIEVLDPSSQTVVAHSRHRGILHGYLASTDLYATRREDPDGYQVVDVWRLALPLSRR